MTEPHPDLLSSISKVEDTEVSREAPAGIPPSDDSVEASSDMALEGLDPVAEPPAAKLQPVETTPVDTRPEPVTAAAASVPPVVQASPAPAAAASPGPVREDMTGLVTKDDLAALKRELAAQISALDTHVGERMQVQGWALLAGVALLMAIAAAVIELF